MSRSKRTKKSSGNLSELHQRLNKDDVVNRLNLDRQATQYQPLLNKAQLAKRLGMTVRGVEEICARRLIPKIVISRRCVRFDFEAVKNALAKLEVREIGR